MKFAAFLLAGIAIGVAVAYWRIGGGPGLDPAVGVADGTALEQRLSGLETELKQERLERRALADELAALQASLAESAAGNGEAESAGQANPRERIAATFESGGGPAFDRLRQRFPNGLPADFAGGGVDESVLEQRQIERFVAAGLAPERAQWILNREDELQMEVLNARYEAQQNGTPEQDVASVSQKMREELGDTDYEKYLEGLGRPTTINVRDVLSNSPAEAAGLQAGDQIVAYDGKRVFDMNELTGLTYEGQPGASVAIDVIRDGQQIQLYVERGPIGVSGGGRSLRRRP
jgi:PDZ domain